MLLMEDTALCVTVCVSAHFGGEQQQQRCNRCVQAAEACICVCVCVVVTY